MAIVYGTDLVPSDKYTLLAGGSVQVAIGADSSIMYVGGMDTANGTASAGTPVRVTSTSDAEEKFGLGSELARQASLAFQNEASPVYMVGVSETDNTESISAGTSITLSNTPIMDPNLGDDNDITVTDTDGPSDVPVSITYESPPPTPTGSPAANVNPLTGEVEVDSSGNYDVDYTYGDYSTAVTNAVQQFEFRNLCMLTEDPSIVNDALSEINPLATTFDFRRVFAGATPFADTLSPDTSNYTDSLDDLRASLVASSRGYLDINETEEVRTVGAVAAYVSSLPIGPSSTADSISGIVSLRTPLDNTQASDMIEAQVLPLQTVGGSVEITKDMTTSTDQQFERIYTVDIVDEIIDSSHLISRQYIGNQNTGTQRLLLDRANRNLLQDSKTSVPKLLDDFTLTTEQNDSNQNKVDITMGLDVVNVIDTIDVTVTVGDVVTFDG